MMELVKKHIHTNRRSAGVISQVTLDEDFNVPDTLDDVEHIILCNGELEIESAKNLGERAAVRGKELIITIETEGDIALEKALFDGKIAYFENVFCVKPVIKEKRV